MTKPIIMRIAYFVLLISLSSLILISFLRPTSQHVGINDYYRARFLDMVEGKAYKPFVYRTLLPTIVRGISLIVPEQFQITCTNLVSQTALLRRAFYFFSWGKKAAFQYLLASFLMLLCFMGFGHTTVLLTERLCNIPKTGKTSLLLVSGALLGLPPFFSYTSFPYDPPQLFLFTLALYYLATQRTKLFYLAFVTCCLNKETAILLIPLYALSLGIAGSSWRHNLSKIIALLMVYVSIKVFLAWIFQENPGTFVEFQLRHNIGLLTRGWTFTTLVVVSIIVIMIFFDWEKKSYFLKTSFLLVLIPLVTLAFFLGFLDEWRGYYEAYPLAFGLSVHSLNSLRNLSQYNVNNR